VKGSFEELEGLWEVPDVVVALVEEKEDLAVEFVVAVDASCTFAAAAFENAAVAVDIEDGLVGAFVVDVVVVVVVVAVVVEVAGETVGERLDLD
jgi:hypothetical protein